MNGAAPVVLPRHTRRKRASFVLTSLIDVIFLLVIFFMVTSQIVPFSTIALGALAREGNAEAQPAPTTPAVPPVAVRVLAGAAMVGGETMPLDGLPGSLAKLKAAGVESLILSPTQSATVQDVVTVLEAIQASGIPGVTVLDRRAAS